jgi:hypothetical protein
MKRKRGMMRTWFSILRRSCGIPLGSSERFLSDLRDRYAGRRCFIVGNGPSLRMTDLARLHELGEVCIASNRIYLAFDRTAWRPSFYTAADKSFLEANLGRLEPLELTFLFTRGLLETLGPEAFGAFKGRVAFFHTLAPWKKEPYSPRFSASALRGWFVGQTVTNVNLQLACWLGCDPIYLIGLDGYPALQGPETVDPDKGRMIRSGGEETHFHPDYHTADEWWCKPDRERQETEYRFAREFLQGRGRGIFNASRQTSVQAFERADLDRILKG